MRKKCCGNSFFEFSQTSTSVCITRYRHREHAFYFFQSVPRRKQLVHFDHQDVNPLNCLYCAIITPRARASSVSLLEHNFMPISACIFFVLFSFFLCVLTCITFRL